MIQHGFNKLQKQLYFLSTRPRLFSCLWSNNILEYCVEEATVSIFWIIPLRSASCVTYVGRCEGHTSFYLYSETKYLLWINFDSFSSKRFDGLIMAWYNIFKFVYSLCISLFFKIKCQLSLIHNHRPAIASVILFRLPRASFPSRLPWLWNVLLGLPQVRSIITIVFVVILLFMG